MKTNSMTFRLPYPVSVNHYYRRWQGRTIISKAGREFRLRVISIILATPHVERLEGRLGILVEAWLPDLRERDLDNLWKPLLDSLQHAGLCRSDSQFRDQHIVDRGLARPHGYVQIYVWKLVDERQDGR